MHVGVSQFDGHWIPAAVALRAADCAALSGRVTDWVEALLLGTRHITLDLRKNLLVRDAEALLLQLGHYLSETELRQRVLFQLSAVQACDSSWQATLSTYAAAISALRPPAQIANWPAQWFCAPPAWVRSSCSALGYERAPVCLAPLNAMVANDAAPILVTVGPRDKDEQKSVTTVSPDELGRLIVDAADLAHELLRWPSARLAADAFRQRRIIVVVQEAGSATSDRMRRLSSALKSASAERARHRGVFPAMEADDVLRGLIGRPDYASWRNRWNAQTRQHQFRHRQLLATHLADTWLLGAKDNHFLAAQNMLQLGDSVVLGRHWPQFLYQFGQSGGIPGWLRPLLDRPELARADQ